jgi:hypothetical protein
MRLSIFVPSSLHHLFALVRETSDNYAKMKSSVSLIMFCAMLVGCYDDFSATGAIANTTGKPVHVQAATADQGQELGFELGPGMMVRFTSRSRQEKVTYSKINVSQEDGTKIAEIDLVQMKLPEQIFGKHVTIAVLEDGIYPVPLKLGREYNPRTNGRDFVAYLHGRKAEIVQAYEACKSRQSP